MVELIIYAVVVSAYVGIFVFWVMALVDILKNDFTGGSGNKIVWLLVVFFLSIFGALLYQFIGKKQRVDNTVVAA